MFDNKNRFVLENYNKKSVFASFLPGISGKFGIPVWNFYVNRGQGITSFGSADKDHSIMEFYPAYQAYAVTKTMGFRTFLRVDGAYTEAFACDDLPKNMYIGMNEFEIEEIDEAKGIQVNVLYYILPQENIGGLVRQVSIKNISGKDKEIEMLDGMPALIPYGTSLDQIKEMGQTVKAWMQVEDVESKLPYFRVRASIEDSIAVQEIKEGNYFVAVDAQGNKQPVIVDPDIVFGYDTSLQTAVGLKDNALDDLMKITQIVNNNMPCAFSARKMTLEAGSSATTYEVIGMAKSKDILKHLADKMTGSEFFDKKYMTAVSLTKDLCSVIATKTGNPTFDAYCEQTYLDNLLRGGYPVKLGKDKIFYLYSRKHGDIERDYNFFQMSPEYYSQGNANFRDVNQNRRCDILFTPYVGDLNIKTFYNLIQTDGYNPLQVQKATYTMDAEKACKLAEGLKADTRDGFVALLSEPFTPGSVAGYLVDTGALGISMDDENGPATLEKFVEKVMDVSDCAINANFGEGYWSDHWDYNLDLVETYLGLYPEKEESLIFEDRDYTYYEGKVTVNKRKDRYEETPKGIRQYHTINEEAKAGVTGDLVRVAKGKGNVYHTTLAEKLLLMSTLKFATLDFYGMGVEMEGGKPGWYDALNGLPGLLGSSMCETFELCRMVEFTKQKVASYGKGVEVAEEIALLIRRIAGMDLSVWKDMELYNKLNDAKEDYRESTTYGVSGKVEMLSNEEIVDYLERIHNLIKQGIERALDYGEGICPSYFAYDVKAYDKTADGIFIKEVSPVVLSHFLEGPVRYMKLDLTMDEKKQMYDKVKKSAMYDNKLHMYKVNESLEKASFEIGRCHAFTPGWLENESIWLHMEYKYLLELIKSGMYKEFMEDFHEQAIPFLDPDVYGRSTLENSSFIASSANGNSKIHGKGFVARLSGSTAEFIHMWQIMMFGLTPFVREDEDVALKLSPMIPSYLIGEDKTIEATLLGTTKVIYHLEECKDYIPGEYGIKKQEVTFADGSMKAFTTGEIMGESAEAVRDGKASKIEVWLV